MASREQRGSVRTAVVWDALESALAGGPRDVVDLGGGTGGFAVRLAESGHRVRVVDPSPDALAALARRAREVDLEVSGLQGDVADLVEVVGAGSADVVLCHGVLEVVDPSLALERIAEVLRPGGLLSLVVGQRHAAVITRAMAGHFQQARDLLDDQQPVDTRTGRRFTVEEVRDLLAGHGFGAVSVHAVRVFADLVPAALVDQEPGAAAALVDLERAVAQRPEYLPLATQLHVLANAAS
ncbi:MULTISPECIES: methyltransferase domain-containing protein [unclassified Nocardioides]|jgi:SAM-dependent methyltransferase|uniref:methyltransferase domain-containing protein n=1 Tax=unclassified Nocardioides TaxID=2615069 RepID=UPI0011510408|nr:MULTISPECIES: methyltransferase domain-containing protein [unclassified Nocardioides]TQK70661.1 methyltransferase family protein [Nocardioides sp. SLBN-35]WGX99952.1 methyltransferase domain-containing protein [Nocardioides sp. QY071]